MQEKFGNSTKHQCSQSQQNRPFVLPANKNFNPQATLRTISRLPPCSMVLDKRNYNFCFLVLLVLERQNQGLGKISFLKNNLQFCPFWEIFKVLLINCHLDKPTLVSIARILSAQGKKGDEKVAQLGIEPRTSGFFLTVVLPLNY